MNRRPHTKPLYPQPHGATRHIAGGMVMTGDTIFLDGGSPNGYLVHAVTHYRQTTHVLLDHHEAHSTILNNHDHVWVA